MSDGGARSTSNFVNCADYLLQTATLQPLPLKKGDALLINFGLHDYNQGLAGVPEYTQEYVALHAGPLSVGMCVCNCFVYSGIML